MSEFGERTVGTARPSEVGTYWECSWGWGWHSVHFCCSSWAWHLTSGCPVLCGSTVVSGDSLVSGVLSCSSWSGQVRGRASYPSPAAAWPPESAAAAQGWSTGQEPASAGPSKLETRLCSQRLRPPLTHMHTYSVHACMHTCMLSTVFAPSTLLFAPSF